MSRVPPRPLKVEQDFTDARLTSFGGLLHPSPDGGATGPFRGLVGGRVGQGSLSRGVGRGVSGEGSKADLAGLLEASRRPSPPCDPRGRPFECGRITPATVSRSRRSAEGRDRITRSASRTPTARPWCWRSWRGCRRRLGGTSAFAGRPCWCATSPRDGPSIRISWSASSSRAPRASSFLSTRSSSSPGMTCRPPNWCAATRENRAGRTPSRGRCGTWTCAIPPHRLLANRIFYACGQLARKLLCAVQFS